MSPSVYSSRHKARWPSLANTPFNPSSALARSFRDVHAWHWDNSHYYDRSVLGWLLKGPSTPHQAQWLQHLIQCGASVSASCSESPRDPLWGVSAVALLVSAVAGKEGLNAAHAEDLLGLVREEELQKGRPAYGGLGYRLCENLLLSQRLDLVVDAWTSTPRTTESEPMLYALCSRMSPVPFRCEAARALVDQGLTWGPAAIALPRLLSAVPNDPGWWSEQLFRVWDAHVAEKGPVAFDQKWFVQWRQELGQALLATTPEGAELLRQGLDARVPVEQRRQWAPELPVFFHLSRHYSSWWDKQAWSQAPLLVAWAADWGLPKRARLRDGTPWPVHLAMQWQCLGRSDFSGTGTDKPAAHQHLWKSLECLANAGHDLKQATSPSLIQKVKEEFDLSLPSSLNAWARKHAITDAPLFSDAQERLNQLVKASQISRRLPPEAPAPVPRIRF